MPDMKMDVQKNIIGRGCLSVDMMGERAEKVLAAKLVNPSTVEALLTSNNF